MQVLQTESGLTLIEVLMVIAILGVLISIVVPNVTGHLELTQETAFYADKGIIQTVVDAYYTAADPHRWPTDSGQGSAPINFACLVTEARLLHYVPQSAAPLQQGRGHYLWWLDQRGTVTNTFAGIYP